MRVNKAGRGICFSLPLRVPHLSRSVRKVVLVAQVVPLSFGGRPEVFPAEFVAQGARARARKRTHLEEGSRGPGAFRCLSCLFGCPTLSEGWVPCGSPPWGRQNVAQGGTGVPSMRRLCTCWGGGTLGTFGEFIQAPSGATLIKRVWHRHYCRCSRLFAVN